MSGSIVVCPAQVTNLGDWESTVADWESMVAVLRDSLSDGRAVWDALKKAEPKPYQKTARMHWNGPPVPRGGPRLPPTREGWVAEPPLEFVLRLIYVVQSGI